MKDNNSNAPLWSRILLVIISYVVLSSLFQFIGMVILEIPFSSKMIFDELSINQLLVLQIFTFFPLLIVVFTLRKYIDKKSIKSIGFKFKYKAKDIGLGFLFALIIIGGGAGLIQYLGFIDISFNQFNFAQVLVGFCLFFIVSISEEILFRGYILNNLLDSMNKYVALIISALIFSSFHGLNSNLTKIGFANLFLAGVLLGSAYVFIKNLWFSISLHLFWNFIQGSILGFSVSGLKIESLFDVKNTGDKIFSGGEFGFEGSLLCTLFTAISILIILMYFIFENKRKLTKSRIEILV